MASTNLAPVLTKLTRQMLTLQTRYLDHLGLGTGQTLILREIMTHYGINEAQVSELLKIDKSTVSRAVKRLEMAGYVKRKKNPRDGRSHHLLSTNMAKALEPLFDLADQSLAQALIHGFHENEVGEFKKYLRKASSNVDHVLHSPPVSRYQFFFQSPND